MVRATRRLDRVRRQVAEHWDQATQVVVYCLTGPMSMALGTTDHSRIAENTSERVHMAMLHSLTSCTGMVKCPQLWRKFRR